MSSSDGGHSIARPRPLRAHRPPSFFVEDDDASDFFSGGHSDDNLHYYEDTSASSHNAGLTSPPVQPGRPTRSSADYYASATTPTTAGPGRPLLAQYGEPSPTSTPVNPFLDRGSNSPQPRSRPSTTYPPIAYGMMRSSSPAASSSNAHGPPSSSGYGTSADGGYFPRPQITAASRNSSAGSFAPPPLPWMRKESDITSRSSTISAGSGTSTPRKRVFQSAMITGAVEKPWLKTNKKDTWMRVSWWISILLWVLGVCAAGAICFLSFWNAPTVGKVCLVYQDNFNSLDTNVWQREVLNGGFGNGEFQWYSNSDNNSFVDNGVLYIAPTLTADTVGEDAVFDGANLQIPGCTSTNKTECVMRSSAANKAVLNPVQSARLNTRGSHNIRYGKIEVRARMPKGDWLWPAIWMMPVNETYGSWPMSGEIDITEGRGNSREYKGQGIDFASSALHWGPTANPVIDSWPKTWGYRHRRRTTFADDFHVYGLEWTDKFIRTYVDSPVQTMLSIPLNKETFFQRGKYDPTIQNGSAIQVLTDPWVGRKVAPFDQSFYLILNVAVGSTNGYFMDNVGNKPWFDQSNTAMYDFAHAQDSWYPTWPTDPKQRALAIDYVKMYQTC